MINSIKNKHSKQKGKEKMVLQQDHSDCGVACLLSVINYFGGSNTIENLRRISGTATTGTTLLGLHHAATQIGFYAEGFEAEMENLMELKEPCILHILTHSQLQHYVVFWRATSKGNKLRFIIGDPAKGIVHLTKDELLDIWQSRKLLILLPTKNFKKSALIKRDKRKWIKDLIKEDFSVLSIAVVVGLIVTILGLAMAIFSQKLLDDILPEKDIIKLNAGILLIVLLLFVKEGLSFLRQYLFFSQARGFNIRISNFFYYSLLRLPKPFFDTRKIGELTARLNDTARIQRVITMIAGSIITDILSVLVSAAAIFSYSYIAGMVCIAAIPVFYFLIRFHNNRLSVSQRSIMNGYAFAQANYISTLNGIEAIKSCNKEEEFTTSNNKIYQDYQDKIFFLGKIQIRLSFLANSFGILFSTGILLFCSYQVMNGHLKAGELIAILTMTGMLLPGIASLAIVSIPISEAKVAFDRMFEFTSIEQETNNSQEAVVEFQSLKAEMLSFRFPGRKQILSDISFTVEKGEIIAIMGENGCGKSTLTQLLQKNYQQESGKIIINNSKELSNISFSNWRQVVGVVPQNIHIFNGTVIANIAFDDAVEKQPEVLNFLQEYRFNSFIDSLPQSFMTLVGEEGINLSGGQKQIIALARALYKQPQVLILDEATAAMDRESEQFVLELLQQLKPKIAVIFITHRLYVLKSFCDRVYILENGKISACGNHEQLLNTKNLYSDYWNDLVS